MDADQNKLARQDKLDRAYARLRSLKANLPENARSLVEEHYVLEYHEALQHLHDLGIDVAEFRVAETRINPAYLGSPGTPDYHTKEQCVDRNFLMSKIDSVLGYFEFITAKPDEPQKRIGFRK